MVRPELPDVEMQRQIYRKVLEYAGGKPVVFRTLDVGGDKVMPYWPSGQEENPAMGWRAIRVSIDRPAMLRQQLRALIQAAAGQDLWVMFPMVTEVAEFQYARAMLDKELERVRAGGGGIPSKVRVGAMLEVPALIYQLPELLRHVDFLSIGTNDLFQFMFASDRGNYEMSERYDNLSPVALNILRLILQQCQAAGVPVSICGEMAARPLDAMALIGIGFRSISVSPPAVGAIKATFRGVRLAVLEGFMASLCGGKQHSLRETLKAYAIDHGVMH